MCFLYIKSTSNERCCHYNSLFSCQNHHNTVSIFMCVFFLRSYFNRLQQTKSKCLILSMWHFILLSIMISHFLLFWFTNSDIIGLVLKYNACLSGLSFFVVIFAYAAFHVSKVCDIWDLDKVFSNLSCHSKTIIVALSFPTQIPNFLTLIYSFVMLYILR